MCTQQCMFVFKPSKNAPNILEKFCNWWPYYTNFSDIKKFRYEQNYTIWISFSDYIET